MVVKVKEKNLLGKKINCVFTNILKYDLLEEDCVLRYELRYRDPNRESVAIPDSFISVGEWKVPHDVLNAWSGSNLYLAERLCQEFDLEYLGPLGSLENV